MYWIWFLMYFNEKPLAVYALCLVNDERIANTNQQISTNIDVKYDCYSTITLQ